MSVGRRVFLAVLFCQLFSVVLILGWYFLVLRSELDSLKRQGAEETVLQSIAATEDYLKPAELALAEGQLLLSQHILGSDNPEPLERYFFEQLRVRPLLDGLYVGNPAGEFFQVMRSNEKTSEGTRTKVIRNGPLGREVDLTWRRPDYSLVKTERDSTDAYDPRARVWYRSALGQRTRAWTEPYIFFTSQKPGITLASAIAGKDGAVKSVLGIDIEISQILRFLSRYGLLEGKSVYIATKDGKVIAHSNANVVAASTSGDNTLRFRTISELPGAEGTLAPTVLKRLAEPASPQASNVWEAEADGQRYYVAVGRMSNIDWPWQVVVTVPRTGLVQPASDSTSILIVAMSLAILLAVGIGYATSRSISVPMARLLSNAQLARKGNVALMESAKTGLKEIHETNAILLELATRQRSKEPRVRHSNPEQN